jgi:hypothetical protein
LFILIALGPATYIATCTMSLSRLRVKTRPSTTVFFFLRGVHEVIRPETTDQAHQRCSSSTHQVHRQVSLSLCLFSFRGYLPASIIPLPLASPPLASPSPSPSPSSPVAPECRLGRRYLLPQEATYLWWTFWPAWSSISLQP